MNNNIYNPTYKVVGNRNIKIGIDIFHNKDYSVFSNLFNLTHSQYHRYLLFKESVGYLTTSHGNQVKTILDLNTRIEDWLNDVPTNVLHMSYYNRHRATEMYRLLTENIYFEECGFRGNYVHYRVGYYSLMKSASEEMFFTLVVKKEYIKYVKLCVFLGEPILEDCFEFWYDEHMVLASGDTKIIKSLSKILKDLSLMEVSCIAKQNILSLFQPEIKFIAPSISQQKAMIDEFTVEFTKHELSLIK